MLTDYCVPAPDGQGQASPAFDVRDHFAMLLTQPAVFATVASPQPHTFPGGRVHLLLRIRHQIPPGFPFEDRDEIGSVDQRFVFRAFVAAKSAVVGPLGQRIDSLPRFRRKECRAFFAGILPEPSQREIIAGNLGISARNDYAMLERIGGECAGAVTLVGQGQALPERDYSYRKLSEEELAAILKELPKRPLLAGEKGIRLSLAGAQDKVAVRIEGGEVCLPLGGAPSTHILKPAVDRFEGVVFNEALCMKLAAAAGLPAAAVETRNAAGIDYLVVERSDRVHRTAAGGEAALERLHQEDFRQALGIDSEHKYQKEGGPSLKACFGLLRAVSSAPVIDLARLLDAVVYNYFAGNNDAHGKNFSLLYRGAGTEQMEIRPAPLYDIVSTLYYPELSREMAMKIGGASSPDEVTARDFEQLAQEAGLGKPLVRNRVLELGDKLIAALPSVEIAHPVADHVAALLRRRVENAKRSFRG